MLTDMDDDFFFEEDKFAKKAEDVSAQLLLPLEASLELHQGQLEEGLPSIVDCADSDLGMSDGLSDFDAIVVGLGQDMFGKFRDITKQKLELARLGMRVTTNSVVILKDDSNLIGISIGGGAPVCPCLYIVQVFDGTPAAREGSLQSGDELLAVNSASVKGKSKVEVAKMIQHAGHKVIIHYNKLHADPAQGKSLDIVLKKLKHRIVDTMSSNTADTLGLSRAILCNDSLVKRLEELEGTELMYKGLVEHARRMLKAYYDIFQTYKSIGDCFAQISTREPQQRASETFRLFGEFHRNIEKDGLIIIKQIRPVLSDLGTYLNKAIPDTKLTVRRYADAKFTYLSYCLKVKEMDDEEHTFATLQEPLYRVETGNYEYRLILRCRQEARAKFAKLRTDVLEKMELLECKHSTDLNKQLRSLLESLADLNYSVVRRMDVLPTLFPIEVDFKDTDFQYKSSTLQPQELDDDDEEEEAASSSSGNSGNNQSSQIVCGLEAVEQPAPIICTEPDNTMPLLTDLDQDSGKMPKPAQSTDNEALLLEELGLCGIDLMSNPQTVSNQKDSLAAQKDSYDFDLFLNQAANTTTQLERDLMSNNARITDLLLQ